MCWSRWGNACHHLAAMRGCGERKNSASAQVNGNARRHSHHEEFCSSSGALHSGTQALISIVILKEYPVSNSDRTVHAKKCRLRIRHPWRVKVLIA